MPSECLFSLYLCFWVEIRKVLSIFTNGEVSPANTVYRKQCSDNTALTYNMCNSIQCEIFQAVSMDLSFRISALCIEDRQWRELMSHSMYEKGISVFVIGYILLYILKIQLSISRGLARFFFFFCFTFFSQKYKLLRYLRNNLLRLLLKEF